MVYASRGILRILLALLLFNFTALAQHQPTILSTNAAEQYLNCIFDGGQNCDLYLANRNFIHHNPSLPIGDFVEFNDRTLPLLQVIFTVMIFLAFIFVSEMVTDLITS